MFFGFFMFCCCCCLFIFFLASRIWWVGSGKEHLNYSDLFLTHCKCTPKQHTEILKMYSYQGSMKNNLKKECCGWYLYYPRWARGLEIWKGISHLHCSLLWRTCATSVPTGKREGKANRWIAPTLMASGYEQESPTSHLHCLASSEPLASLILSNVPLITPSNGKIIYLLG